MLKNIKRYLIKKLGGYNIDIMNDILEVLNNLNKELEKEGSKTLKLEDDNYFLISKNDSLEFELKNLKDKYKKLQDECLNLKTDVKISNINYNEKTINKKIFNKNLKVSQYDIDIMGEEYIKEELKNNFIKSFTNEIDNCGLIKLDKFKDKYDSRYTNYSMSIELYV
jgi:predicted RNase H-like nuclease (RuvC/YqgF family)